MDFSADIKIWDSAVISIDNVKHGLLVRQDITECFESSAFIYAAGDSGKISFDGRSYPVKSNCLLHIAPNQSITIRSEKDELEYFIVVYHAGLYPGAGRRLLADTLRQRPFHRNDAFRTSAPLLFSEQFAAMANEWSDPTPLSLLKIKQCFYTVICALYAERSSRRAMPMTCDAFDFVYQYLQQNYPRPIRIHCLADMLGITRSTLHKQFKDRIGISPQQYLMQLRLEAARQILVNHPMPIDEIAASCGLRDKSYFTRIFKEKYGQTPGSYRKDHRPYKGNGAVARRSIQPPAPDPKKACTLIENLGRMHRYFEVPRRIVCLDYAAAEICAALGVAGRITGVASADESLADCAKAYRSEIAKAPFLSAFSSEVNVPSFRAVCDCKPDIVIGTGYSFNRYGGVADAEDFESRGIHIYAMKATYTLDCSYDSVYEDIRNLGLIFGAEGRAETLVQEMISEAAILARAVDPQQTPVRVFSFDVSISDQVITCGRSLESQIIRSAGGINVFGDRAEQFVTVNWHEVRAANPQIILVHCLHTQQDGLQKIDFLKQVSEIAETEAMQHDRIHLIGIKKVFPGLDNLKTARHLFEIFRSI